MVHISFSKVRRVLCLGAHSDDIEIGCGGTLLRLFKGNPALEVLWVVFSAEPPRDAEARRSAMDFLRRARRKTVEVKGFRGSFFPFQGLEIKECFEDIKSRFAPDLVFTHYRDDRHQDHRVLSDLAWNTFRSHVILEYEIPKYDGDLGIPNMFVPLSPALCRRKLKLIMRHFQTQNNKHWFTEELFFAQLRIRGMECGARYAEAFHGRKLVF